MASTDEQHTAHALRLARRGLGSVWPNPAVGCVLVEAESDAVLGRGWTQAGGRPHAETEALARAGDASGATAYVSLEPCNHHGLTPPCSEALIAAGVGRVVVALRDPDPRVDGAGLARLRDAGIEVDEGVGAAAAATLNAGYLLRLAAGRPLLALKTATTLDGRIASAGGASQWITGRAARARGHLLRARHDAVMVGIGTVLSDDPSLTCRLPGLPPRPPVRLVVDSRLRIPPDAALVRDRAAPTWVLTTEAADADTAARLADAGVEVIRVPADPDGRVDVAAALTELAARGLTRVLVEGGAELSGALMRAGLVDRVYWFRAGAVMGGDGLAALPPLGVAEPDAAPRFVRASLEPVGDDVLETYAAAT